MRRARFKLITAFAAAVLVAMAMPLAFGIFYTHGDLGSYYIPLRLFYARCLSMGDDFAWCPNLFCGYYVHGEGQIGMYHPLHLILYRVLPFRLAFMTDSLIWYLFMLPGMYLLLRRLCLRSDAALFGSLIFTFSNFNLFHFGHMNAIAVTSHIPWLLATVDVVLRDERRGRVTSALLLTALLTTSQALHGYPHYLYLTFLAEALYVLFILRLRTHWWRLLSYGGAVALGLLGGSIQLLPSFDSLAATSRDFSFQARYSLSLHPANLTQFVSPFLFREGFHATVWGGNKTECTVRNSAVATVLIVWILLRFKHLGRMRSLAIGSIAFAALTLILSLGRYGYLYRILLRIPLIGIFRVPARHIMLFQLATSILASIAFMDLMRLSRNRDRWGRRQASLLWIVPGVGAVISMIALTLKGHVQSGTLNAVASTPQVLAGVALLAVATALTVATARGVKYAWVALVLFAIADQFYSGFSLYLIDGMKSFDSLTRSVHYPPEATHDRVHYMLAQHFKDDGSDVKTGRSEWWWRNRQNIVIMNGFCMPAGYCGLIPAQVLDYHSGRRRNTFRVAGIRWLCIREQLYQGADGRDDYRIRWVELPNPSPRARLVTRAVQSSNIRDDIELSDVSTVALVSTPLSLRDTEPGEAVLSDDRPGRIDVQTSSSSEQLLVLSESYHQGWQAKLDNRLVPLIRVYGDFMGCLVGPGQHRVELRFRPRSLTVGFWLSVAAFVAMAIQFWFTRRLWNRREWSLEKQGRESIWGGVAPSS